MGNPPWADIQLKMTTAQICDISLDCKVLQSNPVHCIFYIRLYLSSTWEKWQWRLACKGILFIVSSVLTIKECNINLHMGKMTMTKTHDLFLDCKGILFMGSSIRLYLQRSVILTEYLGKIDVSHLIFRRRKKLFWNISYCTISCPLE